MEWDTAGNRISAGAIGGACVAAGAAFATSRIFVRGSVVHVVSLLRTSLLDAAEIVDLEAANGFAIRVTSGRRGSSVANQQSLMAEFTGNRRGRRAARR